MIRVEDIRLPELSPDASEADRRLMQALYDQFRDVGARLGALEATLGTVPRRMSDTITAMPTLTATYIGYGSAANALTGSSELTYTTATGQWTLTKSLNSSVRAFVSNTNAGAAAYAAVAALNNAGESIGLLKLSSGYTTAGLLVAYQGMLLNDFTSMLFANSASSDFIWSRGGTGTANEVMRLGAGALSLGLAGTTAGSLALKGLTSGTATLVVSAVAGTPTLTLPTNTGTLALTSDITATPYVTAMAAHSGRLSFGAL